MKSVKVNGETIVCRDSTPLLLFINSERSLTFAKLVVDGKEYEIKINEQGKAQMK